MCKYCESVVYSSQNVKTKETWELMENLPIQDDFSLKYIIYDENKPVQYIRRCRNKYFLITEFGNTDGTAISVEIIACPMCNRKFN